MDDEVGGPLICTNFSEISQHCIISTLPNVFSEVSLKNENVMEANDLLKNGILIETSKGVEWLSLTEALTSGVGGLNLSVEDFQNVAAQLLSTHQVVNSDLVLESSLKCKHSIPENNSNNIHSCFCAVQTSNRLESIEEGNDNLKESEVEEASNIKLSTITLRLSNKKTGPQKQKKLLSDCSSSVTLSESTNSDSSIQSVPFTQVKRKGGWPKGRKRKPESENRPPKAPQTGYVIYLNEKRKLPLFKDVPFHEVTKVLGNEWSKLDLSQKRSYLELAEIDKKRYREELRIYRNSDAYQAYLRRKRIKSLQANGTEESDIDATDEIEDEDSEELYCRVCDQWFTSLHNKKEHLYGRQHFQSISQLGNSNQGILPDACSTFSLDESSLDAAPLPRHLTPEINPPSVTDAMANFMYIFTEQEREVSILQSTLKKNLTKNKEFLKELQELKSRELKLTRILIQQKEEREKLEKNICTLCEVPSFLVQMQSLST